MKIILLVLGAFGALWLAGLGLQHLFNAFNDLEDHDE